MKSNNRGGKRPGSGRKTLDGKPAGMGARSERIHVTLSASQIAWVKAQECSISDYIRALVDNDISTAGYSTRSEQCD